MIQCEKDAKEFVEKYITFQQDLWKQKNEWELKDLQKCFADNIEIGWQGQYTKGIEQALKAWGPFQGACSNGNYLGYDIEAFDKNFVKFTGYAVWDTFKKEKIFLVNNVILIINDDGKVEKQIITAKTKYVEQFNSIFAEYASQKK